MLREIKNKSLYKVNNNYVTPAHCISQNPDIKFASFGTACFQEIPTCYFVISIKLEKKSTKYNSVRKLENLSFPER
jgi:hypothetical protein